MAALRASKRIEKERQKFVEDTDNDAFTLVVVNAQTWLISFEGAPSTIYAGEKYTIRVKFTDDYPIDSPEVAFQLPSPKHAHIYSNGHICLNILGEDWSPALTIKSVCLSILSMLSSATTKEYPPDNYRYTSARSSSTEEFSKSNPKNTRFVYHDDSV
jgi:ubiquitin-conjugating enzyme E2 W